MRTLTIAIAFGAAALLGGTAANADSSMKTEVATIGTSQSTDFSAQYRHYGYRHHRHYRSYGYYAPRRVYYAQPYYAQPYYGGGGYGYGYGGPSISLGFGGFGGHHGGFGGGFGGHHGGHY